MISIFRSFLDTWVAKAFFVLLIGVFVVLVMGPAAFDTDELSGAKPSVPAGQTVVLYFYLPQ